MEVIRPAVQDELHARHAAVVREQRILAGEPVDPVRTVSMSSGSLIDRSYYATLRDSGSKSTFHGGGTRGTFWGFGSDRFHNVLRDSGVLY